MCIQHSASTFPPGSFGKLLLKIVRRIQSIAWVSFSLLLCLCLSVVPLASCGELPVSHVRSGESLNRLPYHMFYTVLHSSHAQSSVLTKPLLCLLFGFHIKKPKAEDFHPLSFTFGKYSFYPSILFFGSYS